MLTTDISALVN